MLLKRHSIYVVALLAACLAGPSVHAQDYFGRNKVQYKALDFQVMKTEHFDIYFYPSAREGVEIAARMAERWYARLERLLEHQLRGRQPLVLYASHVDFEQTNVIQGELGEGTGGVTESVRRRIVLPMGGPLADTDHVIGHELVHAFQFDMTMRPGAAPGETGAQMLPLWFIEGMAEYLSLGPVDTNTAMWLRDAARIQNDRDKLPTLEDLNNLAEYFPYRWGHAFWAYVGGKWGDRAVGEMLRIAGTTGDLETTTQRVLGLSTKELGAEWQDAIRRTYGNTAGLSNDIGRVIIKGEGLGRELNVGPTVSPDGNLIAFLSGRSLFSIDLFVAEAATGKVIHKLTSTATDAHYSSIQFIYSSGSWTADSKRLAIATVTAGKPAIAVFDVKSGDKEREIKIPDLDEVFNPTWAPDGNSIAFTGMSRGLTDLYVFDIARAELKALTHDAYADLQPSWSPDGRRIAFATDRFASDMNNLSVGPYRLAVVDVATATVEAVRAFTSGRNINPQWAPESDALYFISDRDGISNLYRVELANGDMTQVTSLITGVSGITGTSPALSVSPKGEVAVFNVYNNGGYDIRSLPVTKPSASPVPLSVVTGIPGMLPPIERRPSQVAGLLGNPSLGLPEASTEFEVEDYNPKLALEAVGQPTIAVGADRFGAAVSGGLSFFFSDMLGDHNLAVAFQIDSSVTGGFSFKDTAAQAMYLNQSRRWNWGITGGQIPYHSGYITQSLDNSTNQTLLVQQTTVFRQTERSVGGLLAYPFNRAERLELKGGYSQITFDQIVRTQIVNYFTDELLADNTVETQLQDSVHLFAPSAALVHDATNFGATGPVQGMRYRLEASPQFGSLRFIGLLGDYRRYFMPVPFYTLAARVVHYGRYGPNSEDSRLYPLYIGYPSLVRGYDIDTFDAVDCIPTLTSECPAFDRLQGSRMLVGNIEFRFPLLRPFGIKQNMYGPVPTEVALFADAGTAWNQTERPSVIGGGRDGVSSAGVAVRVNLFGFVSQFSFARPFQRPHRSWVFQWSFVPGF